MIVFTSWKRFVSILIFTSGIMHPIIEDLATAVPVHEGKTANDITHLDEFHTLTHSGDKTDRDGPSAVGVDISQVDEAKTLRKMDIRLIPILTVLYLLSFMDRGYEFRAPTQLQLLRLSGTLVMQISRASQSTLG